MTVDHYLRWIVVTPPDVQKVRSAADFGHYARARRKFLGLSQQGVALIVKEDFGIPWHQTVVAKIESGERQVKLDEALALSLVYGIDLQDLMTGRGLTGEGHLIERDLSHTDALVAEVEAAREKRRGHGEHPEAS